MERVIDEQMSNLQVTGSGVSRLVFEATELYQIDVEADRLKFRTFTASGILYDGFDLTRRADGRNMLSDLPHPLPSVRTCTGGTGPDGGACVARGK